MASKVYFSKEITAEKVLEEKGYLIKTIDVVGVKIGDTPGKLSAALSVLDEKKINIEGFVRYGFIFVDLLE